MARPPRHVWRIAFRNFLDSFKPRQSKTELIGEDLLGNKYFESKPTASSHRTRPSRYYLPAEGEEDFDQKLPSEWEAWLRGRRKIPPTTEEIAKNNAIAAIKKENAKKLESERAGTKQLDIPNSASGFESFPNYGDEFKGSPGVKK